MAALICNLPSVEVWVRKEYLTDHQSGHGEFVKASGCRVSRYLGTFVETYLPEYAAMYDLHQCVCKRPETPSPDMDLPNLQFWMRTTALWMSLSSLLVVWTMNCIQRPWYTGTYIYYRQLSSGSRGCRL